MIKTIFNNWFIKIIVLFALLAVLLYGFYYYIYPTPYYYTQYSTDAFHYFVKIDRKTGNIYRFSTNTNTGRTWELLNK